MPDSLSLELQQRPSQNIKQLQRLLMSRQMQQAIHFLQVPIMELAPLVDMEMEQNPVLEYADQEETGDQDMDQEERERLREEVEEIPENEEPVLEAQLNFEEDDFEILRRLDEDFRDHFLESGGVVPKRTSEESELQSFIESSVTTKETLFEHLLEQARLTFSGAHELELAETLIGNIDDKGFLTTPLQELALLHHSTEEEVSRILKVIQTFHPIGVGARDLKESLLIQLRFQKKEGTLAYDIIENYFDDLLHNRIGIIRNKLHCTAEQIGKVIDRDIAKLDLHPGAQLNNQVVPYIIPDATLRLEGESLIALVNDDTVPSLRLNSCYLRMLRDDKLPKETKDFIKQKVVSAKWLMHNIMQRNSTIERIADNLAKRQQAFFLDPKGKLVPLTMKTVADELEIHESTVARAVSNKYIDTPRGVIPLRSLFTSSISTDVGEDMSSRTVREILMNIVGNEDKKQPLSDEAISALMKQQGIKCARRTIAKYRAIMKIGSAQQRRKY